MRALPAALLSILLITQQCSCAVSPTGCDAVEPVAAKALDLINKGRWDGYLFQLLRVADAHLERVVIGQCKVIAITRLAGSEDLRVNDFNCTTSSVSSALTNTIDSPVLFDFFEDTELYREQADNALEKYKRENSDFAPFRVDKVMRAVRAVFGFCRADLFYDVEASDLETPKTIVTNCEVFNLKVAQWLLPSLTQESSQEIDCNDQDVFKAVDTALKKYNSGNKSGNQFVLYRVTEVSRTDNPDIFYSLKYQIKEGDCPFQSDKTWQDCDYKDSAQAATGECTVTVAKRGNMKFSVATQTCLITPAEGPVVTAQYDCLGCVHPISTTSPDLEPVLRHAIQHFNNNTDHPHLFDLKEVKRAQRQDIGECSDKAYVDLQLRIASFLQKCDLYPGEDFVQPPTKLCVGCPKPIPVDSPELEEPLNHSIAKLNAENNGTFYFKIDTVKKATVQTLLMKRPPGFSPFRSVQVMKPEEKTTMREKTEETTLPSPAQPGVAVTFPGFQDSDLIATVMPNTLPPPTESDDDWIPDIQIEPNSLAFKLISDFPETTSPKCPGRPWKPVNGVNPTVEMEESHDFDLTDALS
ncbi:hypothetical protein MJG53_000935 [Ovis ammon polii x Ovis aries]|uniref:Uncharacterized protein n=1 Tax=Ovis ammon polii x Ovis aries TaxID=2918886 RepID=A0ACB9VJH4_9CETA|nr:hypothetical protein MJT46_000429 [Ovis ammon polii x Ovis aries]KAI4589886.1 hypothetical protein MJG53_000935 [Ovis ammon polii x Ovis aries]